VRLLRPHPADGSSSYYTCSLVICERLYSTLHFLPVQRSLPPSAGNRFLQSCNSSSRQETELNKHGLAFPVYVWRCQSICNDHLGLQAAPEDFSILPLMKRPTPSSAYTLEIILEITILEILLIIQVLYDDDDGVSIAYFFTKYSLGKIIRMQSRGVERQFVRLCKWREKSNVSRGGRCPSDAN